MGGLENGLVNLINQMPVAEYRHAIACIESYSDFRDRIVRTDVPVFALERSRIGVWRLRAELYALCRRLRPAVLHTRNLSALDALLPARLAGIPHRVHGEHGWDVDDLHGTRWRPAVLRKLHSPLVDRYVTVSKHLERFLVERVGIAPSRISQIYNGVDTDRFTPAREKRIDGLPPGFADNDTILIGAIGRIQPVKDHATLLHAFANLLQSCPDMRARLRLAVVGDGPLLPELRRLADTLRIGDLTWLPGALEDVPEALCGFDLFVLPSLAEGISNTLLEAMAAGVPVVATATGGNLELVDEGRSGRFFPPGDVAALTALLQQYALQPRLRDEHGQEARRIALEKFALSTMVARYQAMYDMLCGPNTAQLAR